MKRVFAVGTTLIALACGSGSAFASTGGAAQPSDVSGGGTSSYSRDQATKTWTADSSAKASWQSGAGGATSY